MARFLDKSVSTRYHTADCLLKTDNRLTLSLTRAGEHRKVRCGVLVSRMADSSINQYINQL